VAVRVSAASAAAAILVFNMTISLGVFGSATVAGWLLVAATGAEVHWAAKAGDCFYFIE
jgi:hypothetical protein